MFVFVFPKIKAAGIIPAACVGNVKNIFEPWIIAENKYDGCKSLNVMVEE